MLLLYNVANNFCATKVDTWKLLKLLKLFRNLSISSRGNNLPEIAKDETNFEKLFFNELSSRSDIIVTNVVTFKSIFFFFFVICFAKCQRLNLENWGKANKSFTARWNFDSNRGRMLKKRHITILRTVADINSSVSEVNFYLANIYPDPLRMQNISWMLARSRSFECKHS